jgi:hypothetical protein
MSRTDHWLISDSFPLYLREPVFLNLTEVTLACGWSTTFSTFGLFQTNSGSLNAFHGALNTTTSGSQPHIHSGRDWEAVLDECTGLPDLLGLTT